MNKDTALFTTIKLTRSAVYVFIDTFFAVYFFKLCNYNILPIGLYFLVSYIGLTLGFWLVRKAIKKKIRLPYQRMGIALLACYLTLILLLKSSIIKYIVLVALIKGLSEGIYHFPTNVLDTEKISNKDRTKYQGIVNIISVLISIIMPLIIGYILTFHSYANVGKIFMIFIVLIFFLSFLVKDEEQLSRKEFNLKKFSKVVKKYPFLKRVFLVRFLSGFTFSSGVLNLVITLYSIIYFKTNMNIGILNSSLAILSLITLSLYTYYVKPKNYNKILDASFGIIVLTFCLLIFYPGVVSLIVYLLLSNTAIVFINVMLSTTVLNVTNTVEEIKEEFKAEYHLTLESGLGLGRIIGYLLLIIIGIFGTKDHLYIIMIVSLITLSLLFINFKKFRKEMITRKK